MCTYLHLRLLMTWLILHLKLWRVCQDYISMFIIYVRVTEIWATLLVHTQNFSSKPYAKKRTKRSANAASSLKLRRSKAFTWGRKREDLLVRIATRSGTFSLCERSSSTQVGKTKLKGMKSLSPKCFVFDNFNSALFWASLVNGQKQDFLAVFVKESKHEPELKTFSHNGM